MKIDGQCHCGAIQFEAELNPQKVVLCHCNDCQQLSGTAYREIAIVAAETFGFTKGAPKKYVKIAESGNERVQAFCENCGSGMYASENSEAPELYFLRLGTINQRADIVPKLEIWRESAKAYLPELTETKKFDKGPQ